MEAELGAHFSEKRYEHIKSQADKDLLAWAVKRGAGCIWFEVPNALTFELSNIGWSLEARPCVKGCIGSHVQIWNGLKRQ